MGNEEINLNTRRKPIKRFNNWSIYICDRKWPYYGGHTIWLANLLNIDYLYIGLCFEKPKTQHWYYDGYHHYKSFYLIYIEWGGRPFIE